jgi:quinol monooxygenase YgiN
VIQHVVIMKFAVSSDREEAKLRLEALPTAISQLTTITVSLDIGMDGSPSDLVLISTHADRDGLRGYLEHPVHQQFVAWVKPLLVGRAVVDSETSA